MQLDTNSNAGRGLIVLGLGVLLVGVLWQYDALSPIATGGTDGDVFDPGLVVLVPAFVVFVLLPAAGLLAFGESLRSISLSERSLDRKQLPDVLLAGSGLYFLALVAGAMLSGALPDSILGSLVSAQLYLVPIVCLVVAGALGWKLFD